MRSRQDWWDPMLPLFLKDDGLRESGRRFSVYGGKV